MILFKALTGSRLHGLHSDTSDYDWKLVEVSPLRHVISPFRKLKGKDSVSPEEDNCTYEFVHFAKLFAASNPTILEILWSTHLEYDLTHKHLVTELIEGRKNLLDKDRIFYAHRGYASDQRKKMSLDQPNEHRTAKAIVAYVRIMLQGISLLNEGDFDPTKQLYLFNGNPVDYKDLLMEIKYGFDKKRHPKIAEGEIQRLEFLMEEAWKNCKLEFKSDLPWIEYMIEKIYLELGNENTTDTTERQQVSRCTN